MESITYKCPNCDGGLVFEPGIQKFKCGYCLSKFSEEELKKLTPDYSRAVKAEPEEGKEADGEQTDVEQADGGPAEAGEEPVMMVYTCPSCGAQVMTDETTASTFCYYCHNPVVLSGKLEGRYKPDSVLPFEMDKKAAAESFKGWISRKKYVPKDFYSPKQMELMEGIYYPYWLYDCQVDGRIAAETTKVKISRMGAIEYTETSRFNVERRGTMDIKNVTKNALKKADHRLSEAVLPFDTEKMRPFQAGYLSGFQSERRDIEKDEYEQDVQAEIQSFAMENLKNSISGYDSVTVREHEEKVLSSDWRYALFPVWVLTYRDGESDKLYYFAMNGQSGKICGVLPVDYKRLAGLFFTIFFPLLALFLIGGYFI